MPNLVGNLEDRVSRDGVRHMTHEKVKNTRLEYYCASVPEYSFCFNS